MHYFLLIRLQRQQPTHRQSSMGSAERTKRLSRNRLGDVQCDMLYLPVTESIRYHCGKIGIPLEMTDIHGNLLWFGEYTAWKNHYKCKSYLT